MSAKVAVGAIFFPPTPTAPAPAPTTEEAATSIGDGGVAEEPASGAPVLYPTQDEIDVDNNKQTKLLAPAQDQIDAAIREMPNLYTASTSKPPHLFKQGASMEPEAYTSRYPPGQSVINNPMHINTSPQVRPSYSQHVLRGVSIFLVRPDVNRVGDSEVSNALRCPRCEGMLKHERMSTSPKIIFKAGGRPAIAVEAHYKCRDCPATATAVEPAIRMSMPARARNDLPVSVAHAVPSTSWYVGEELEDTIEWDQVTYQGCDALTARMQHALAVMYEKHRIDYFDHIRAYRAEHPDDAKPFMEWPPFEQWCGRAVPSGSTLRHRLETVHYSKGSAGDDMSRHEFRVRQLQATGTTEALDDDPSGRYISDVCFSSDHTHDAAKAFHLPNVPTQKKVWNCVTGWLKVLTMVLVTTQSSTSFLHAAECLAHRPNFNPTVHYTDTWPNDEDLWSRLLPFTRGRLDVFHFMKRILDTLRQRHCDFNQAAAALSKCIFQYNEDDMAAVRRALKDGTLNGTKHTDAEINAMIEDGRWKKNYAKYIDSLTFSPETIEEKIFLNEDAWCVVWPEKVDSETNETLGTRATTTVLENQRAHCNHICDVASHTQVLKAKPNQKHNLVQKRTTRGGKVEIFHSVQGDFANGNMKPNTGQMLIEEGAVMFTMDRDAELKYQMGIARSPDVFHYRPWDMHLANKLAAMTQMPIPYPTLEPLQEDNGERFLYDYFLEQVCSRRVLYFFSCRCVVRSGSASPRSVFVRDYCEQEQREKDCEYFEGMTCCPCSFCTKRRENCDCDACTSSRQAPGAFAGQPLADFLQNNKEDAATKLQEAAREISRILPEGSTSRDARRARQLEQLATMVRGDAITLVLEHAPSAGIDVGSIVGYIPPASASEDIEPVALTAASRSTSSFYDDAFNNDDTIGGTDNAGNEKAATLEANNASTVAMDLETNVDAHVNLNDAPNVGANPASTTSATTTRSQPDRPEPRPPKRAKTTERFRPERLRKHPDCPTCTCRFPPIDEENKQRRLAGDRPIRGNQAKCKPDCPQGIWLETKKKEMQTDAA